MRRRRAIQGRPRANCRRRGPGPNLPDPPKLWNAPRMSERSLTTNRTAAGPISLSDGSGAGGQVGTREIGAMDEERWRDALYPRGLGVGCEGWSSRERVARVLLRPNASYAERMTLTAWAPPIMEHGRARWGAGSSDASGPPTGEIFMRARV
jgi:hypothetical protein